MAKKVLITGGAGFIGHHVINHILLNTDWDIFVLDKLNYASMGMDRIRDIDCYDEKRVNFFHADFTKKISDGVKQEIGNVDYIIHMGAETHVDRSITDPWPFIESNVIGTFHMLEFAKTQTDLKKFLYFSTDEVFGPAPEGVEYKEWDRYNSGNPYSATKAGGEELCLAYANTYRLPIIISHTMNVFGERQHPEKFIPMCIRRIKHGLDITIHANSDKTKAGSRFWIHARNVADAIMFLLDKGQKGDKYNIVGECEVNNLDMAKTIAEILNEPLKYEMVDFHSSRPGHDLRYALDGKKLKDMGFEYKKSFVESLRKTVEWTLANTKWLGD